MALNRQPDGIKVGGIFGARKDGAIGGRSEHVVFIPWENPEAQEWVDKTNQWNLAKADKFEIVVYDHNETAHATLIRISADPNAVVYIRGHGNPGAPYVQVKVAVVGRDDPEEKKLPINDACQRLIDMGLRPAFAGAIKFYSCHSGTKLLKYDFQQEKLRAEGKAADFQRALDEKIINAEQHQRFMANNIAPKYESLAAQGAAYLRKQGFTHCVYYGYLGPLGSTYEKDSSDEWHKVVELEGLHDAPKHLRPDSKTKDIKTPTNVRPSVGRVRV
jgi:hypothetical protein